MKKSKKFITGLIVLLIVAIAILLIYPDLIDNGKKEDTKKEDVVNVDSIPDNPFD